MSILDSIFGDNKIKDPVCGMAVDPKTAKIKTEKDGKTYYFCSPSCKDKYLSGKVEKRERDGCC